MKEDGLYTCYSTGWTMQSSNPGGGKKLLFFFKTFKLAVLSTQLLIQ